MVHEDSYPEESDMPRWDMRGSAVITNDFLKCVKYSGVFSLIRFQFLGELHSTPRASMDSLLDSCFYVDPNSRSR